MECNILNMIDFKETLTNLHTEFPEFDLDVLFRIMDTIVETSTQISYPYGTRPLSDKPWWEDGINRVTCDAKM